MGLTGATGTEAGLRRVFAPGEEIFREGEAGDVAYIIERGRVEISNLVDGRRQVLAVLLAGDLFGEMALIDQNERTATARALDETEVVCISDGYVHRRLTDSDPLIGLFLRVVLARYREMRGQLLLRERPEPTAQERGDLAEQREAALVRLRFEEEIRLGLENGEFEPFFQPIIDLRAGRIAGFEALARWHHPERGLVPPGEFIGIAEQSDLIKGIGLRVFERACAALRRFEAIDGVGPLSMSVNLSGRQLDDPQLPQQLAAVIERSEVAPERLKLEIVESLLMGNPELAEATLLRLKGLGAKVAIDDFGTGYSSLSYLHRFPIDTLKIDRSFVISMQDDIRSMEIVRVLSDLSRGLQMSIIAEGVETAEQRATLYALQCDFGQGFLFSRPLPEKEAVALLQSRPHW